MPDPPPLPPPFADFDFAYDPALAAVLPYPPPPSASADLFSPSETTDILGFLDTFDDFSWDLLSASPPLSHDAPQLHDTARSPYSNPHLRTAPRPSTSTRHSSPSSPAVAPPPPPLSPVSALDQTAIGLSAKILLSSPQKRLNHIMSEQKRRNTIRDGYAQLITLLAPAGSASSISMPSRGRPKGSGSRGKGQTKGKSGVLFRAVEYCRWLEEGRAALAEEVARVETALAQADASLPLP